MGESLWEEYLEAMRAGRYFHAHEVLEGWWRQEHNPRLQAAIWFAVLLLHSERGNAVGVCRVADKLAARLRREGAPADVVAAVASPLLPEQVWAVLAKEGPWFLRWPGPPS